MTNSSHEDLLDATEKKKANDDIDFDLKMVRGMTLTYFIYGVISFLDISAFLVPLPVAYYMLPIAAAIMYVRSSSSWKAIVLLFIPILVLKDLWINVNPTIVEPLLLISIVVWLLWGIVFFVLKSQKELMFSKLAGLSQFLILVILFPVAVVLSLVMLTVFVRKNMENENATVILRISFLIQMMYAMYLLQVVSNFLNS